MFFFLFFFGEGGGRGDEFLLRRHMQIGTFFKKIEKLTGTSPRSDSLLQILSLKSNRDSVSVFDLFYLITLAFYLDF